MWCYRFRGLLYFCLRISICFRLSIFRFTLTLRGFFELVISEIASFEDGSADCAEAGATAIVVVRVADAHKRIAVTMPLGLNIWAFSTELDKFAMMLRLLFVLASSSVSIGISKISSQQNYLII